MFKEQVKISLNLVSRSLRHSTNDTRYQGYSCTLCRQIARDEPTLGLNHNIKNNSKFNKRGTPLYYTVYTHCHIRISATLLLYIAGTEHRVSIKEMSFMKGFHRTIIYTRSHIKHLQAETAILPF